MDDDPRVEERLRRIDGLRGSGGRVVLLAEVRKLLAEAEAALAGREGGPKASEPSDPPPGPPSRAA
jgi:hypothetical protein